MLTLLSFGFNVTLGSVVSSWVSEVPSCSFTYHVSIYYFGEDFFLVIAGFFMTTLQWFWSFLILFWVQSILSPLRFLLLDLLLVIQLVDISMHNDILFSRLLFWIITICSDRVLGWFFTTQSVLVSFVVELDYLKMGDSLICKLASFLFLNTCLFMLHCSNNAVLGLSLHSPESFRLAFQPRLLHFWHLILFIGV